MWFSTVFVLGLMSFNFHLPEFTCFFFCVCVEKKRQRKRKGVTNTCAWSSGGVWKGWRRFFPLCIGCLNLWELWYSVKYMKIFNTLWALFFFCWFCFFFYKRHGILSLFCCVFFKNLSISSFSWLAVDWNDIVDPEKPDNRYSKMNLGELNGQPSL